MSCGIILSKLLLWGLGGIILVSCGVMTGFWPVIFNFQLQKDLVLTNVSRSYGLWKTTPIPVYMEVYMFNWTNPNVTIEQNAKANFMELGPYVFREEHQKEDIVWNTNGTVTFKQKRTWHFIPELSKGSLDDLVTNVNLMAMVVGNLITKYLPSEVLPIASLLIEAVEKDIYVTKTVNELLFQGYPDKFLEIAKKLQKLMKIKIPFDKLGLFYKRNNSIDYDGTFNIKTGLSGLDDIGEMVLWNYNNKTEAYLGPCGVIQGSNGDLWPVSSARDDNIKLFITDICSNVVLKRDGDNELHGVKGSRFIADKTIFDNGDEVADNICYCPNKFCPPTGARDVSHCHVGLPAFVSLPHFYLADPSYLENITGMYPSPEKHNVFLSLEKVTSIPLEVHMKVQINIRSEPFKHIKFYERLPYAYMPLLWFHISAAITPELASEISSLTVISTYVEPVFIGLTILGGLMIITGLVLWRFRWFAARRDETPLLDSTSS